VISLLHQALHALIFCLTTSPEAVR
jgi:hypothetical protein